MSKKKAPAAAAPAKAPAPPTKTAAPPQSDATPTAAPDQATQGADFSQTPANASTGLSGPIKPLKLDPAFLPPPVPGIPTFNDPARFKLTFDPPSLIDWSAMRQPFLTRGVPLGAADGSMIEQNWIFSYNQMVSWGLSGDIAAKIANIGTPLAYDFSMARDYPTTAERLDRDLEKMMGPGKKLSTFTVPIITPDTLNWAVKHTFGKDIDFRF